MQLDQYIQQVSEQLRSAAALGDERTQQVAAGLADATASAVRLALLGALSNAAAEITAELIGDSTGCPGHTVTVRLDEHEPRFVVTNLGGEAEPAPVVDDGEATARISLRLSEALKTRIDEVAAAEGISVNTWLVRAASTALAGGPARHTVRNSHRITGWVTG